jgi:YggT family protein
MKIFSYIYLFAYYAAVVFVVYVTAVVIARSVIAYLDLNPFSWFSRNVSKYVRRFSEPFLAPVRSYLIRMGFKPTLAPLLTILLFALIGFYSFQVITDALITIKGSIVSVQHNAISSLVGYLLSFLLSIYSLMIMFRIVLEWLMIFGNRLSKFLYRTTEPILAPFRRRIPTIGMFDFSPLLVFLLIMVLQRIVVRSFIAPSEFISLL